MDILFNILAEFMNMVGIIYGIILGIGIYKLRKRRRKLKHDNKTDDSLV